MGYIWKNEFQQNNLITLDQIKEISDAITEINSLSCSSQFGSVNSTYVGCNCQSNYNQYYGSIHGTGGETSYRC